MELGTSYCFDDILMEPLLSNITSRKSIALETNIATNNRKLILKTPLISSPMDTVTETDMAIKMALNGGLGIIHRYMSIEDQVSQVTKVKRFLQYIISEPYKIKPSTTLEEIEELRILYNVSSFCVVDDYSTNNLLGIITKRDIEYMKHCQSYYNNQIAQQASQQATQQASQQSTQHNPQQVTILYATNFMTQLDKLITIDINNVNINTVCISYNNQYNLNLESTLSLAKDLIHLHKIEKIPILKGSVLIGLITLKNICHYENNKFKACIDSNGALCVGSAIGIVDDYMERLDKLVNAGSDLICIDVANGFNTNIFNTITIIRSKYPSLVLMVGNVCNWQGYAALSEYDVDCIRIGVGNGSICTTRLETGIGKGQFSAVSECFKYKIDAQNINNRQYPNLICDGGSLGKTGNKVKALACGSSAIMLGRTLASTIESPGTIIHRNGKRFKYIRGMASTMANLSKQEKTNASNASNASNPSSTTAKDVTVSSHSEGVDGEQELSGSVVDVIEQINGGLKSGMSYLGCETIEQLHNKNSKNEIKFNIVTSIGMSENGIRVKTY
jgi:IMP dehydrogenase